MKKIKLEKSLKTEFLGMFIISLVLSFTLGLSLFYLSENIYTEFREEKYLDERERAKDYLNEVVENIEGNIDALPINSFNNKLESRVKVNNLYHLSIADENGSIIFNGGIENLESRDFLFYDTIDFNGRKHIVFVEGRYQNNELEREILAMLVIMVSVLFFVAAFFKLTNKRINYINEISQKVDDISGGNLDTFIDLKGNDELTSLAGNINYMAYSLKERSEYEDKVERSKRELITNMSHDLRSPLTSIIGYLNLIKDSKNESREEIKEYAEVSYNKAIQLKELTERLFEYSKITSEKMIVEKQHIDLNLLINQIKEEYAYIIRFNKLNLKTNIKNTKLEIFADPLLIVRLFENLIMNAVKYAKKPGDFLIETDSDKDYVYIRFKNKIKDKFNSDDLDRIFERMYIKDEARQEGKSTGLGLAISKEIVEMNGGKIWAETKGNDIIFNLKFHISNKKE
ncbi:MAG: HAMP domain-containing sensor histidine kinase [Bacillota bacterium]|nr:HAMP domain-containing sensor histidine kinase [Bacillota bacterium]